VNENKKKILPTSRINIDHYICWNGSSRQNPTSYDVSGITYDRDGNLSGLTRRTETGSENTYSYSYASGSNRLSGVTKNGVNTAFGEACPERMRRNRNGNVSSIGTGYEISWIAYDWRNLPLSINLSDPFVVSPTYRYDHHAGSRTRLGNRTYSGLNFVRGAFGETLAVYNGTTLRYHNIVRPDGTVIGRREGSNRLYYHRDHLGSTRAVANASGTVVETQDYYPFGLAELVPKTFGMPGRSMTTGNSAKEKFPSHELDDGLDLYYMIARRYAPEFGRFLSVDPLADRFLEWSPYNYALNNPLFYTDPDGRCPLPQPACLSLEAAFGPITSFISNLFLPDQSSASVSVEVQQGNTTIKMGIETNSILMIDANGLPTGFDNTTNGFLLPGVDAGPVQVSFDGEETSTLDFDGGKVSGVLQVSEKEIKAGVNFGNKHFRPGVSVDNQGRIGTNVNVEAEGRVGSLIVRFKAKIESMFNPGRAVENAAKTSANIERKLRAQ